MQNYRQNIKITNTIGEYIVSLLKSRGQIP